MSEDGSNCIFCKIARKEMATSIEYEDKSIIAFNDRDPQAPVHVLIIPKKHIEKVDDVTFNTMKLLGKMTMAAEEIARKKGVSGSGYRVVINCGKDGGQLIKHLHMHLLGGRQLSWPPG